MRYTIYHLTNTQRLLADIRLPQYAAWDAAIKYATNDSGELSLTIAPTNPEFAHIGCATSEIIVERDGSEIWRGRVTEQELDANGNKHITVKGVLDYLHDTILPQQTFTGTAATAFESLISAHNAKPIESRKKFVFGGCDITDDLPEDGYKISAATQTWAALSRLIRDYGGYLSVRRENDANVLRWVRALTHTSTQTIVAGKNLLSLKRSISIDNLATVIYAYGKVTDGVPLGIESVNNSLPYIKDDAAVASFGWIEAVFTDTSCDDPQTLKSAAEEALADKLAETVSWEISAVDLADLGVQVEHIEIGDLIPVQDAGDSAPETIQCTELKRYLFAPQKTKLTLGATLRAISNLVGGRQV